VLTPASVHARWVELVWYDIHGQLIVNVIDATCTTQSRVYITVECESVRAIDWQQQRLVCWGRSAANQLSIGICCRRLAANAGSVNAAARRRRIYILVWILRLTATQFRSRITTASSKSIVSVTSSHCCISFRNDYVSCSVSVYQGQHYHHSI